MRKRNALLWISAIAIMIAIELLNESGLRASSEITQKVDGRIVQADAKARTFMIAYQHPATYEKMTKEFVIDDHTRLKNVKGIENLRKGDIVSVDYREVGNRLEAFYVERVLEQVQYVKPQEVAASVFQIKPSQEK